MNGPYLLNRMSGMSSQYDLSPGWHIPDQAMGRAERSSSHMNDPISFERPPITAGSHMLQHSTIIKTYWQNFYPYIRTLTDNDIGKEIMKVQSNNGDYSFVGEIMILRSINYLKKCNFCNRPSTFICTICKIKFYCSKECQKKDWQNHKKSCKKGLNHSFTYRPKYDKYGHTYDKITDYDSNDWVVVEEVRNIKPIRVTGDTYLTDQFTNRLSELNPFLKLKFNILCTNYSISLVNLKEAIDILNSHHVDIEDSLVYTYLQEYYVGIISKTDFLDKIGILISRTPEYDTSQPIPRVIFQTHNSKNSVNTYANIEEKKWVSKLKKCIDKEVAENQCVICITNEKKICAFPCGHLSSCASCVLKLYELNNMKCPICRSDVKKWHEIFMS